MFPCLVIRPFVFMLDLSTIGCSACVLAQDEPLEVLKWIDFLVGSLGRDNALAGATLSYGMAKDCFPSDLFRQSISKTAVNTNYTWAIISHWLPCYHPSTDVLSMACTYANMFQLSPTWMAKTPVASQLMTVESHPSQLSTKAVLAATPVWGTSQSFCRSALAMISTIATMPSMLGQ